MQMTRSKWFQPAFAVGLGVLLFSAMWIGGDRRTGLFSLAVMAALRRRDPVRWPQRDGARPTRRRRDERFRQIDLAATAIAGMVLITVIIGAFLVEVARGQDGSPYAALGAVAGVAYLGAIAALRLRG